MLTKQISSSLQKLALPKEQKENIDKVSNVIKQLKALKELAKNNERLFNVVKDDLRAILDSPFIKPEEIERITNSFNAIIDNAIKDVNFISEILSSDNRTKITELKGVFLNTYPNTPVDWDYEAPYYKLRAGAYRSKSEATRLLYKVREQFPDAYIVRNNKISPIDLL